MALNGTYFDGRSSRGHAVHLSATGKRLLIAGPGQSIDYSARQIDVGEYLRDAPHVLLFADGARCEIADNAGAEALLRDIGWRAPASRRAERVWWMVLAGFGLVALAAIAFFWQGLPWLARTTAPHLPRAWLATLSEQTLTQLDQRELQATKLPGERQEAIRTAFHALAARPQPLPDYQLHFRAARDGAPKSAAINAFALPDGQVVILDGLVELARNDQEIAGVIAHELGHVAHRHGAQMLISGSVTAIAAAIWLGDVSSLVAGLGAALISGGYSREAEREADAFAAERLAVNGLDPGLLADLLERMDVALQSDLPVQLPGALSTHPDSTERIANLRRWPHGATVP